MSKFYGLTVMHGKDENGNPMYLADVSGGIGVISYVGKDAIKAIDGVDGDVTLEFVEVSKPGPHGEDVRSVAKLTADAGTVAYVLKAKLAAERKANKVETSEVDIVMYA